MALLISLSNESDLLMTTPINTQVRTAFGIKIVSGKSFHRALKKDAQTPVNHGHQVWQSSYLMMDYLSKNPLSNGQHVMDIGCGWGLGGIYCAKFLGSHVSSVDGDERVFNYVNYHQKLNDVTVKTVHSEFKHLTNRDFAQQDVILGSDICYLPEMFKELKSLIVRSLAENVSKIIFADPGRPPFKKLVNFCRENFSTEVHKWKVADRNNAKGYILVVSGS